MVAELCLGELYHLEHNVEHGWESGIHDIYLKMFNALIVQASSSQLTTPFQQSTRVRFFLVYWDLKHPSIRKLQDENENERL